MIDVLKLIVLVYAGIIICNTFYLCSNDNIYNVKVDRIWFCLRLKKFENENDKANWG